MVRYVFLFILCLFVCLPHYVLSSVVKGHVSTPSDSLLPYVNVFVKGTTNGTTTNEHGEYELELEAGEHVLVFKYVGYKRNEKRISLAKSEELVLDVTLSPRNMKLNEVVVTGENPGERIMRKVITHRKEHLNQVDAYSCKTYVKSLFRVVGHPEKIMGQENDQLGILDTGNSGIVYLSESRSRLHFEQPDKYKEEMIASKVSGDNRGYSFNRASMFQRSIYQNNIRISPASERMFISPASSNAFFFYNYEYMGAYHEQGHLIHKIGVSPQRKNDPVFQGVVYVIDSLWRFKSFDLQLKGDARLNDRTDSLRWHQVYEPVNDSVWIPLSQRFNLSFTVSLPFSNVSLGGYYAASYSDYQIRKGFPKGYFTNELLSIQDSANLRDSSYWNESRPVPLTREEQTDYKRKDSLNKIITSKSYLDSIDKTRNKFKIMDLITGYDYQRRYYNFSMSTDPIYQIVQYNTVEGAVLNFGVDIEKSWDDNRSLTITPDLRYGFSNKHFSGQLALNHYYDPHSLGEWGIEGGKFINQYDQVNPHPSVANTFYSLLLERNYMKIYEKAFLRVYQSRELWNGVKLSTGMEWGERYPLTNTTDYKWIDWERSFTGNEPPDDGGEQSLAFNRHRALHFHADLRLRFAQKYISRPDQKIVTASPYPDFKLHYKKSVPGILGSDLNYDYVAGEIKEDVPLGLFGNTSFRVSAGSFINKAQVTFPDYKHFTGNRTFFGDYSLSVFERLPYYEFSTISDHAEAHVSHHFDGFLFKKIPAIQNTDLQVVIGAKGFYQRNGDYHIEGSIGLENILRFMSLGSRIDYVFAYPQFVKWWHGIRIGVPFMTQ